LQMIVPYRQIKFNGIPAISCFFAMGIRIFNYFVPLGVKCHFKIFQRMVLPEIELIFHF